MRRMHIPGAAGFLSITLCLMLLLGEHVTPAEAQICPAGLSHYWTLDEGAGPMYYDLFGTTDAACTGCPTAVTGIVNGAQQFGLAGDLQVPADASFDWEKTDSFSIELWMKSDGTNSCDGQVLIGRDDEPVTTGLQWWIGCWAGNKAAFQLLDTGGTGGDKLILGTKTLNDGLWHHIVAVWDAPAGQKRLYVDGVLDNSINVIYSTGFTSATEPLTIGWLNYLGTPGFRFSGTIDEVALYRQALSLAEVRSHYYLARGYCETCSSPVKIMPLGDSITWGTFGPTGTVDTRPSSLRTGYRQPLYLSLIDEGFNVNFVGSKIAGESAVPAFDPDNEGLHGSAEAIAYADSEDNNRNILDWLQLNPADVVLLHIGTNSITETQPINQNVADVEEVLNKIDLFNENITVVLAKIINRTDTLAPATTEYNQAIAVMANQRIANGDKIILVDHEHALAYPADMTDPVHPNASGYTKMANVWHDALTGFLPLCSSVPHIFSTPVASAAEGQPYTYDVNATGNPIYSLATAPSGMTIDPTTGLIQWTPGMTGTFDVTVQAVNSEGSDTQAFTVIVDVCPSGMIHYWKLDEDGQPYVDLYGSNATCSDCPAATTGIVGGAQQFNTSTRMNVSAEASLNWEANDSFSIELWMKSDGTNSCEEQVLVGRDDEPASGLQWWVGCWTAGNKAAFQMIDTSGFGGTKLIIGSKSLNDGLWHHVVAVRDGAAGQNRLYVDGSLEGTANVTYSSGFDSATAALNIGWLDYPYSAGLHFTGTMDEVALYNKALSGSEIQQHYTHGADGNSYCYGYYAVTPSAGANGSISPGTPQIVIFNATPSFTVTPHSGYHIDSVTGCGGTLTDNTYTTGPVSADCTVAASFAINTYTVTPSAGANGSMSPDTPQTVNYNATTAFTVTPNNGHHISSVTGCSGSLVGSTYTTGAITTDCMVTASFEADPANIGVSPPSPVSFGSVNVGSSSALQTFTVSNTGNIGLVIGTLTSSNTEFVTSNDHCSGQTIAPAGSCTVDVTFTPSGNGTRTGELQIPSNDPDTAIFSIALNGTGVQYTVTPWAGTNGSISPATPQTINYNATTSFTVTPGTGYHIASASGCDGTLAGNTYTTGPITADCTVSATFARNTYTVTPLAGANGRIRPYTPQTVKYNATKSFIVRSRIGYHIASVSGCGGTLAGDTYTTGPITADCTVSATFARNGW